MRVRPVELFSLGDSSTLDPQSGGPYSEIATAQKPNLRIVCIRAQMKNKCTVAENRNSGKKS
jgi:hypothetical protein